MAPIVGTGASMRSASAIAATLVLAAALAIAFPAAAVDFLIPGISLESLSLEQGAQVAYLVLTTSFGEQDSSYVRLAVRERSRRSVQIEIVSSPYPYAAAEATTVRFRLPRDLAGISSAAELRGAIGEILVREGTGPFRKPEEREVDDFGLDRLFEQPGSGATRRSLSEKEVRSPAGLFRCSGVEVAWSETKRVKLGGVEGERRERGTSEIWRSPRIPFWGVVRSRIEKGSETSIPGARTRPGEGEKTTVTESILLSFRGSGAR